MALGHAGVQTKGVKTAWDMLIGRFGNEVEALIYAAPDALKMVDERIVKAIVAFRNGDVIIHPGGGGQYGWLELPENLKEGKKEGKLEPEIETQKEDSEKEDSEKEDSEIKKSDSSKNQSSLFDF